LSEAFIHHIRTAGWNLLSFFSYIKVFKKKPWFKELELSWVGDYNPRMIAIYEALGARIAKTHITYDI